MNGYGNSNGYGHGRELDPTPARAVDNVTRAVMDATKIARAIHLCSAGYDMASIATEIGFSSAREAKTVIYEGLKEMQFEAVEEYREVELNRLDRITKRLFTVIEPYLVNGADPSEYPVDNQTMNAMALYLKVSERRAKYTNMESSTLVVTGGGPDTEPIKVQIVEDVERFTRFITERVIEMQANAPQLIAGERVDEEDLADGGSDDFNLSQLRGERESGPIAEPSDDGRSREGNGSRMGAGHWSDTPRSASGGGATIDTSILPPDSEREAG